MKGYDVERKVAEWKMNVWTLTARTEYATDVKCMSRPAPITQTGYAYKMRWSAGRCAVVNWWVRLTILHNVFNSAVRSAAGRCRLQSMSAWHGLLDGSPSEYVTYTFFMRKHYTTSCLKKLCKLIFCQNFVKFRPIVEIFGRKIEERTSFSEVYSFATSPNLCQRTTVLNADVQNCYITL